MFGVGGLGMNIHFATCNRYEAEKFFEDEAWNYLSKPAKDFVLDNLCADGDKMLRVQDPMMHPEPCLIMSSTKLRSKIVELL